MFCDVIEREDVTVTVTLQKHQLSTYRNLQLLDELIAPAFKDPQGLAREKEQSVAEKNSQTSLVCSCITINFPHIIKAIIKTQ